MKVTASRISRLHYPAKKQGTHWSRSREGLRAGREVLEKIKINNACRYSSPWLFMAKTMNMNDQVKKHMITELLFCLDNINHLKPELNTSTQRCLTRFFAGNFASWTAYFVIICVKNQQMHNSYFSLLIMCGSSYMFRHYIAILRERS
jgi:hypothetical protein